MEEAVHTIVHGGPHVSTELLAKQYNTLNPDLMDLGRFGGPGRFEVLQFSENCPCLNAKFNDGNECCQDD